MRDEAPLYYNDALDFYALTRFQDNLDAFVDKDTYTLHLVDEPRVHGPAPSGLGPDDLAGPARAQPLRGLVSKAFTPRRVSELEARVRAITTGYLDALVGRERFDVVAELTARLPMDVISALLGIPEADRRWVQESSNAMLHRDPGSPLPRKDALESTQRVLEYFDAQIAERRARPRDDMMTLLTQVDWEDEDGGVSRLSDSDIRQFLMLLATAGNETVTKLLATACYELWRNPDERERLIAEPRWIPNAVEELLRFDPPSQYQGRVTTRDVVLHGQVVPKHSRVLLINGATGRDERRFTDPDRFDVRRKIDVHLGFGYGRHVCLGASLVRLESRIAIEELLRRFPHYEVPADGIVRMHSSNVRGLSGLVLEPAAAR